jgi:hypothetical protein
MLLRSPRRPIFDISTKLTRYWTWSVACNLSPMTDPPMTVFV